MGRIPGAPTHLSNSVVSVRMLRKQGEVWGDFLGFRQSHPRAAFQSFALLILCVWLSSSQRLSVFRSKKEQHNFPKWGQGGIPGFNGMLC